MQCSFPNVRGWDKGDKIDEMPGRVGVVHLLSDSPGEYEIKVLWKNHLARSIKFTVGPDGKFDNGIAAANHLGSDRVIVPVQILGARTANGTAARGRLMRSIAIRSRASRPFRKTETTGG